MLKLDQNLSHKSNSFPPPHDIQLFKRETIYQNLQLKSQLQMKESTDGPLDTNYYKERLINGYQRLYPKTLQVEQQSKSRITSNW